MDVNPVDADPNRISAMCWDGRHRRCTGWMVVAGTYRGLCSVRCECPTCRHPPVLKNRHLFEPPQKGILWSSSILTPW